MDIKFITAEARNKMKPRILVVGSINMDLLMMVSRMPLPGESMLSEKYQFGPGGKGANQAVAAAQLGGDVTLACKVGDDEFGAQLKQSLINKDVCVEFVSTSPGNNSGFGVIMMEESGNNRIITHLAANRDLNKADIDLAFTRDYDGMIVQFEIIEDMVIYACEQARKRNIPFVVDAGPALNFPLEKISGMEILSPNETETQALCGITPIDKKSCMDAAQMLTKRTNAKHIVLKMGDKGAMHYHNGQIKHYASYKVEPVDVTAAGDVFTAAMTVRYLTGGDMDEAIRYANAAGALAVTKAGAQESVPCADEVSAFIKKCV